MSKRNGFIIFNVCLLVFCIAFACCVYVACMKFGDVSLIINVNKSYQTMEGFGASMTWNAQLFGDDETTTQNIATMLYGDDGMGLSIYRYNIGAGTKEIDHGYWIDGRATESFFDSSKFVDISSFGDKNNYDFSKDQNAFNVFKACMQTGNVKTLVLFANSPHYLMTTNGKGHADEGTKSNLPQQNYAAFADYLLIIAQHFYDYLQDAGLDVKIYISPVNEPQWDWSDPGCGQEGCHFDPDELAKFYDVFCTKLVDYNAAHHTDFYPEIFESGSYVDGYQEYINEFKKYDFYSQVQSFAFHSYMADNNARTKKRLTIIQTKSLKACKSI